MLSVASVASQLVLAPWSPWPLSPDGSGPPAVRRNAELWVGCIAGALLADAGFVDIDVEPWRVYDVEDAREFLTTAGVDVDALGAEVKGRFASAFVRATKP